MNIGNLGRIAMAPHRLGMTRRPLPMSPIVTGAGPLPTRSRASIGLGAGASPAGTPPNLLRSPSPVLRYWRGGEVPALKNGGTLGALKEPVRLRIGGSPDGGNDGNGGMGGGGGSSGGDSGGSHGESAGQAADNVDRDRQNAPARNAAISSAGGASKSSGSGGSNGPMGNATVADYTTEQKYLNTPAENVPTDKAYWSAVSNLGPRANDYADRGNSFIDNVGNKILGLASIGELDPTRQPLGASTDNPNANWGVDPLGVATTAAGIATGLPIGTLYKGVKAATGWEGPMISFGGPGTGYQNQLSNSPVSPQIGNEPVGYTGPSSTADAGNFGPGVGQATNTLGQLANPQQPVAGTVSTGTQGTTGTTPPAPGTGSTTGTGGSVVTTPSGDRIVIPYTGNPYTYGQTGGEWAYFNPESLPPPKPVTAADGGTIKGPGDGQDDKIPALLSSNEHIIDAGTVAMAGRGDSDAGHRVIENWKRDVRKRAGFKNPNKAPIMKSIGSLATMRRAA